MDLPDPTDRKLIHNRKINCKGYKRTDGDFDIEAELIDSKTYDFPSKTHGTVFKDTPYHHMKLRITVDSNMTVKDAAAITLSGPYNICPQGANNFKNLYILRSSHFIIFFLLRRTKPARSVGKILY